MTTHDSNNLASLTPAQDHRVREIRSLKLKLRSDLKFSPHIEAGEECYLVEDSQRSRYFRIGIAEYFLVSMFDGKTTVGEAMVRLAQTECARTLDETQVTAVCKWLIDSELAYTLESRSEQRLASNVEKTRQKKRLMRWNPLCSKIPLSYPDRHVARITPLLQHAFGRCAGVIGLVLFFTAAYQITSHWEAFSVASAGIFSPSRWIWLGLCWLVLKFVHELAHAVVCRMYGGNVHEAGIIVVLFAPLAYVDVTSSWKIRSKWKRIHIAAAGMYVELVIASIAALLWVAEPAGLVKDLYFNVIIMAGLTTIVFNANPLMRFDGYYILSDWLEIPNLYGEGQQYLHYLGRRYILGEGVSALIGWSWRNVLTRIYAVFALGWRCVICFSLFAAALVMFDGLGILLAGAAVVLWIGFPLFALAKYLFRSDPLRVSRLRRVSIACAGVAVCCTSIWYGVAWPSKMSAHAIVQYEPIAFVRASSPGFLRSIQVESGSDVERGQVIAVLENRELVAEADDIELAIEQSLIKCRVFKLDDEMHSFQAEMDQLNSLREKLAEKQRQIAELSLRATAAGRLNARDLRNRLGMYLEVGDQIAVIGDESKKELQIMISQDQLEAFVEHVGDPVRVRISGGVTLSTKLSKVEPRGTRQAPDESLYAAMGGPLESQAVNDTETNQSMELVSPHFKGIVALPSDMDAQVRVGQRGVVWFGQFEETVGAALHRVLRNTWVSLVHR